MAWNNNNYEDDNKMSKFNAGLLQMNRLHNLQEHLNKSNINPLAFDDAYGSYNYEIIVVTCTNIVEEAGGKLSPTEKTIALLMREKVNELLKKYPIHEIKKHPNGNKMRVNEMNWKFMKEIIFKYEDYARGLLDKHNLNSPLEDESALF